jgi:F0F1-type ATP synthase epsilon subunit
VCSPGTRRSSRCSRRAASGFFKVEQDRAIALVDDAVDVKEIDSERARAQLEEARSELERLEEEDTGADRWQIEQRIKHAENMLSVAGHLE